MNAYYNDFDEGACAWLEELMRAGLIPSGVVDRRSILDVHPDDLRGFKQVHFFAGIGGWAFALRLAGWPDDRPVWTGSPPCQPFSAAGQQKGRDDARHLAPKFISLVGAARPGVLFGEQVASADAFGKAAKRARGNFVAPPQWAWLDDLSDRLEAARYAVGASDFPSAGVGAPHIRQRTYFGAVSHEWLAQPDCWERDGIADGEGCQPNRAQAGRQQGDGQLASGCKFCGLPDCDCAGRVPGAQRGIYRGQEGAGSRHGEPERSSNAGGVDDCERVGWIEGGHGNYGRHDGQQSDAAGAGGGLADDTRSGWREECQDDRGRAFGDCAEGFAAGSGASGSDLRSSPLHGFWADADWLLCRDGKWRPVEPGTFPLAHGVSGRVGLLRGYGNAINPHAAAQFIRAFGESIESLRQPEPTGTVLPLDFADVL